jgi:hypothetical protein
MPSWEAISRDGSELEMLRVGEAAMEHLISRLAGWRCRNQARSIWWMTACGGRFVADQASEAAEQKVSGSTDDSARTGM